MSMRCIIFSCLLAVSSAFQFYCAQEFGMCQPCHAGPCARFALPENIYNTQRECLQKSECNRGFFISFEELVGRKLVLEPTPQVAAQKPVVAVRTPQPPVPSTTTRTRVIPSRRTKKPRNKKTTTVRPTTTETTQSVTTTEIETTKKQRSTTTPEVETTTTWEVVDITTTLFSAETGNEWTSVEGSAGKWAANDTSAESAPVDNETPGTEATTQEATQTEAWTESWTDAETTTSENPDSLNSVDASVLETVQQKETQPIEESVAKDSSSNEENSDLSSTSTEDFETTTWSASGGEDETGSTLSAEMLYRMMMAANATTSTATSPDDDVAPIENEPKAKGSTAVQQAKLYYCHPKTGTCSICPRNNLDICVSNAGNGIKLFLLPEQCAVHCKPETR